LIYRALAQILTMFIWVDFGYLSINILDAKSHNKITTFEIPEEGYVLMPDKFYLGVTAEYN